MRVVKETAVAGRTIYRAIKVSSGDHREPRKGKRNITPEAVRKNNDRLAIRNLTLLMNANFDSGSTHCTLTYENAPDPERAKKDLRNFIARLRTRFRKTEQDLKYIVTTEYQNKRIHHHIIVNTLDLEMVSDCWGKGFVRSTRLDSKGNYKKLAEYFIKETKKSAGGGTKRRYAASRNLFRPVIKRQDAKPSELFEEDPKPVKGYYIDRESFRRFRHPVTGLEHMEYIMIAEADPRRYKVWPRGTPVSGREHFVCDLQGDQQEFQYGGSGEP